VKILVDVKQVPNDTLVIGGGRVVAHGVVIQMSPLHSQIYLAEGKKFYLIETKALAKALFEALQEESK